MSIINQALKKAQRERLIQETQTIPHLTHLHFSRRRGRWLLIAAGFIAALGVGASLHSWLTAPARKATETVSPQKTARHAPSVTHRESPAPPTPTSFSAVTVIRDTAPDVSPALTPFPQPVASPESEKPRLANSMTPQQRLAHHLQQSAMPPSPPIALPSATASPPAEPSPALPSPPSVDPGPAVQPLPPSGPELATLPPTQIAPQPQARSRARVLFNQAVESQGDAQTVRALALLQEAVKLDPELKVAYNSLGNIYYGQQQYNKALAMYQKALAIDPDYVKARNNLGGTYLRLAMDERAQEELHKVLQIDSRSSLAYYNLACVYARAGDSATASRYLQQAIELEPQARTWAQTDEDFARVRTTPEMRQLLGPS
jgi:hypothetical protein